MIALEWRDVDLGKRQICVQRSDWNGQATTPKSGRLRYVPLTIRLAAAFRDHRHLRSPNMLCQADGQPMSRQMVQCRVLRASRRSKLSQEGVHILRTRSACTWRCAERRRERFKCSLGIGNWA
jgi:integrase